MLRWVTPARLGIAAGGLAVLLIAARAWSLQGWLRPVRVVSGSMVQRLLGEHFLVTCLDCRFPFRYGVESPPPEDRAVCPNCGFGRNPVAAAERRRGDRVLIDRAAYLTGPPQRLEMVAFRDPRFPSRWLVKRVLGLPGEKLAIRRGDLWIDGKRLQKSLDELHRMALLVHDASFEPQQSPNRLPLRWRPQREPSGWHPTESGWKYEPRPIPPGPHGNLPQADQPEEIDWLSYHHWRCYASPFPRTAEVPVADHYGYNQGESRSLQETADLQVRGLVDHATAGTLWLRVHDGREWLQFELDFAKRSATAFRGEVALAATHWDTPPAGGRVELEFGLCDQQILLGVAGKEILRYGYEPGSEPWQPVADPVAIGAARTGVELRKLQLYRDVVYLDPWGVGQSWETPRVAGKDEYLVLGDNPPVSEDSRRWPSPFLPGEQILGRVTLYRP